MGWSRICPLPSYQTRARSVDVLHRPGQDFEADDDDEKEEDVGKPPSGSLEPIDHGKLLCLQGLMPSNDDFTGQAAMAVPMALAQARPLAVREKTRFPK